MNRVGLGLAVGAGYVLGRTKKMKMAFALGTLVAGKRMHLSPRMLADVVSQQLQNNPQFKEIGDQLRQDLRGVGKAASGAMVERQMSALADRLHGRTAEVRDELSGVTDQATGLLSDDEEEPEDTEEEPRDEHDDEEPEDGSREDESHDDREPDDEADDERPAKKAARRTPAKKAPAKKAAAKRAPAKKAPAKKAPAKKTASKQTTAKKSAAKKTTARKTAAARGGARSARARLPKGGGE